MKTFFKILLSFLLLIFGVSLIQTAFSLQDQLFFDRSYYDEMHSVTFFGGVLTIIMGSICLVYALSFLAKSKKSKIILGSIISAIIIFILYVSEKRKYDENFTEEIVEVQEVGEVDEMSEEPATFTSADSVGNKYLSSLDQTSNDSLSKQGFKYNERLIEFITPFKLHEQNLSQSTFINKSRFMKDFAVVYLELDADEMASKTKDKSIPQVIESFNNYSLPKHMMNMFYRTYSGKELDTSKIEVEEVSPNYSILTVKSQEGTTNVMVFLKEDNFFSLFDIISDKDEKDDEVVQGIINSINIKF